MTLKILLMNRRGPVIPAHGGGPGVVWGVWVGCWERDMGWWEAWVELVYLTKNWDYDLLKLWLGQEASQKRHSIGL